MSKKKTPWLQPRHKMITRIGRVVLRPYCRLKYGITIEPFQEQGERPYLILMNHQTPFDQFFVSVSFRNPVYYLATEDIFSNGWISSVIRWAVAPIPIKKQTMDLGAVKSCYRVAQEGGTIAIAPEGNRTYSGKTEYINPAIASLARTLQLPIALYRIEGGYGVQPRWSDVIRKGRMHSYVSRVIEPEEYAELSNEELFSLIETGLYVNEGIADSEFLSSRRAEYIERAIYVCPFCGLTEFESHGNEIECRTCHRKITYGTDKTLTGIDFDFPFAFFNEWYEYQNAFIHALDVTAMTGEAIYTDNARLSEVILHKKKVPLRSQASIRLYGDRITIDENQETALILPFSEMTACSVLGRNKLNLYHNKQVYQVKGGKRFNAVKYVNFYHRYKNITRGEVHGKFLGL